MTLSKRESKLKYPLLKGNKTSFPDKALCPWCKKNKVFEPHSFAVLSAGALLAEDSKLSYSDMEGFFNLTWHGAHCGGKGKLRDIYKVMDVAEDVKRGQFDLYFCSFKCLRAWFNSAVDELERSVHKAESMKPSKRKVTKAPIKPESKIKLVKLWPNAKKQGHKKGETWKVGYYCKDCDLDVIWLVDKKGDYSWTIDEGFLKKHFEIVENSKIRSVYGKRVNHH